MTFGPPRSPGPTADERELLLGFIRWQREQVVATARGLTDAQARWRPDDRLMAIGAIINHLTHMEWRWVEGRYLMRPFPSRTAEFDLDDSVTWSSSSTLLGPGRENRVDRARRCGSRGTVSG